MEIIKQIVIFIFLIQNISSYNAYFKLEINCANDYPDYLITSEGIIPPTNPNPIGHKYRTNYYYIFEFPLLKHNFSFPLCIQMVNIRGKGGFAFNKASINEYDITIINYEDYYYCSNCNLNVEKNFILQQNYVGHPIVKLFILLNYQMLL